jgi:ribosomal protein S27AE
LGGRAFACKPCDHIHFAYHSCNHKACPQCGALAAHQWVQRELRKLVNAPYFLVTFTLPAELRGCFFGPFAKQAYDLFFKAVARALSEKLASDKGLLAVINGFTAALHTWNQRMEFHPHVHCLVPGAGLDAKGNYVQVSSEKFLVHLPHLQSAFRQHFYQLLKEHAWQVDPQVWSKDWGVHIQPAGSGASAVKYLSTYVARTAINDARILAVTDDSVTFRWKDRSDQNLSKSQTRSGIEFVSRYLRHVLPKGLRSVRYYGFCHPTAKASRLRVQLHSGGTVNLGASDPVTTPALACSNPLCPKCGQPTQLIFSWSPWHKKRGPPSG